MKINDEVHHLTETNIANHNSEDFKNYTKMLKIKSKTNFINCNIKNIRKSI